MRQNTVLLPVGTAAKMKKLLARASKSYRPNARLRRQLAQAALHLEDKMKGNARDGKVRINITSITKWLSLIFGLIRMGRSAKRIFDALEGKN